MRRWLSQLFITSYLSCLVLGVASQTLKYGTSAHPAMYFFIWDMFCGWSAYEARTHIIAEGESGTYYWLAPGPWGTFKPFGDLSRNHYDYYGNGALRMAHSAIDHSQHEPLRRILCVEEAWAKKYNLPDHLWALRTGEPKDAMSYFWVRNVYTPEGEPLESRPDFLKQLYVDTVFRNPRLHTDSNRGRPMFAITPYDRRSAMSADFGTYDDLPLTPRSTESSPSAN